MYRSVYYIACKLFDMYNNCFCVFFRAHTDTLDLRARQETLDSLVKMEYLETGDRMELT